MRITVARAPADNPAPEIVETLLSGIEAMTERGRQEIDEQGSPRIVAKIDLPIGPLLKPGDLIEVRTRVDGAWRGKVTAAEYSFSEGAIQTLTVERSA